MHRYVIILFLSCFLALPAQANLGETLAQCVARYGKPVHYSEATEKIPFGTLTFEAAGYALIVFILNDKEVGARISKMDKSAFSDVELQNIKASDSGGSQWISSPSDDPACLQWSRNDHATVLYDKEKHMVLFTTVEMSQALHVTPAKSNPGN
jgi:hypothetical protein